MAGQPRPSNCWLSRRIAVRGRRRSSRTPASQAWIRNSETHPSCVLQRNEAGLAIAVAKQLRPQVGLPRIAVGQCERGFCSPNDRAIGHETVDARADRSNLKVSSVFGRPSRRSVKPSSSPGPRRLARSIPDSPSLARTDAHRIAGGDAPAPVHCLLRRRLERFKRGTGVSALSTKDCGQLRRCMPSARRCVRQRECLPESRFRNGGQLSARAHRSMPPPVVRLGGQHGRGFRRNDARARHSYARTSYSLLTSPLVYWRVSMCCSITSGVVGPKSGIPVPMITETRVTVRH